MRKLLPKSKSRTSLTTGSPYDASTLPSAPAAPIAGQLKTQASTRLSRALDAISSYPPEDPSGMHRDRDFIAVLPRIVGEPGELTRLIERLNSDNPPEDYVGAVREVCLRTAASDAHAREASVALLNQISCGASISRLRAIRLWALMLRYCTSEKFIHKTSRKDFLAVVKEICLNQDVMNQALRSRTLEVVAGARFAYPQNAGFKELWYRVGDGDVSGIRFNNPLFFLPNVQSKFDAALAADPDGHVAVMQRLVRSCEIAHERASRLSELLANLVGAVDQTESVLKDLLTKCVASRSFIQSQLPWATVNAERSTQRPEDPESDGVAAVGERKDDQTFEEQLLGMLLHANEELNDALTWYNEATTAPEPGPSGTRRASPHDQSVAGPSGSHAASSSAIPPSRNSNHSESFSGTYLQDPRLVPIPASPAPPSPASGTAYTPPTALPASSPNEQPPPYALATGGSGERHANTPEPLLEPSTPASSQSPRQQGYSGLEVDIGHALPQNVLAYLEDRRLPKDVLYDVELALEGSSTRDWLAALADIAQLTPTDCKAIALLKRRAMVGGQTSAS